MSLSNSAEYQQTSTSLLLLSNQTDYEEGVLYNLNDQGMTFAEFVDSNPVKMFFSTLWTILAILGIFGNGLVIFIAIAYKKLNDITNCYIFNLAITDLLFIMFCIPFTSYLLMNFTWPFGEVFCKLNHFMSHASVQSTCLTLTAMTIHRCRLIIKNKIQSQCKPKIKKRQKTVLLITIFIWITSFLISSPDLFHFTVEPLVNSTELLCKLTTGNYKFSQLYMKAHHFISIATTYVIPLLIIILSYARLLSHITANQKNLAKFRKAKTTTNGASENIVLLENQQHPQQQQKNESRPQPQQQQRNDSIKPLADNKRRKVTKMVALVTLNFGICWLPTHLLIIVYRSISDETLYSYHPYFVSFKYFAHTLSYLTPVVNPCVYAFYNENFRTSLFDILRRVFYNRPPWLASKNGNLNDSLNKNKNPHHHHHKHQTSAGNTTKPTTTANSNKDVYVI